MPFLPRQHLSAGALNALDDSARSAHLGGPGYLSQENGREQVARNPRRNPPRSAIFCDCYPAVVRDVAGSVWTQNSGLVPCDFYRDGLDQSSTGRGFVALTEIASGDERLAPGTVLLVHDMAVATYGAEEVEAEEEEQEEEEPEEEEEE